MHARRFRTTVVTAAVVAGAFGWGLATGSAEAETGYGSVPACYRTAQDVLYPGEEEQCPGRGYELVFLATGNGSTSSLPACIKEGEPFQRPDDGSCNDSFELIWLYTTSFGGIETCTQPNRTYHAPKQDGSCRPSRELVRLLTSQGQNGSDDA